MYFCANANLIIHKYYQRLEEVVEIERLQGSSPRRESRFRSEQRGAPRPGEGNPAEPPTVPLEHDQSNRVELRENATNYESYRLSYFCNVKYRNTDFNASSRVARETGGGLLTYLRDTATGWYVVRVY